MKSEEKFFISKNRKMFCFTFENFYKRKTKSELSYQKFF